MGRCPVLAGPYRFVSFNPGVELVLEAFEGYWRKPPSSRRRCRRKSRCLCHDLYRGPDHDGCVLTTEGGTIVATEISKNPTHRAPRSAVLFRAMGRLRGDWGRGNPIRSLEPISLAGVDAGHDDCGCCALPCGEERRLLAVVSAGIGSYRALAASRTTRSAGGW